MAKSDNYVYRKGVTPNTLSEISSKTRIFAASASETTAGSRTQVGVISQFDPTESRNIETVRGIGFGDMVAELVPGVTEPMSISVTRTAQYLSGIYQVFGYKGGIDGLVRSLKHHRWPFDVVKETIFSELVTAATSDVAGAPGTKDQISSGTPNPEVDLSGAAYKAINTMFEACWFQDWNTSYTSDSALVQENCTMMVSDVYDLDGTWQGVISAPNTGNSGNSARTKMS
jgi:hypothetical protein